MNILCGVLNQTEGKVLIDDIDIREFPERAKKSIGFLPQNAPLYLDFTVDEYLSYCADLRLIKKEDRKAAVDAVKERCGVAHFSKRLIRNLSGGYRQRDEAHQQDFQGTDSAPVCSRGGSHRTILPPLPVNGIRASGRLEAGRHARP